MILMHLFFDMLRDTRITTGNNCNSATHDEVIIVAKLGGTYSTIINMMKQKHIAEGIKITDGEDLIVTNSFDRPEAFKAHNIVGCVVSFTSLLVTPLMIYEKVVIGGASFNICTWIQMIGKEKLDMMKYVLGGTY